MTDHVLLRSKRSRESGNVFVLIVLMLVPLAALAGSAISLGSRETNEHVAQRGRAMALVHAESGLDRALAQVIDDPDNLEALEVGEEAGDGLRARVVFEELGADGIDNDADGAVDEDDEDRMIRVTSMGCVNVDAVDGAGDPVVQAGVESYVKRVRAIATKGEGLPPFPFAVYLGDPLAEVDMNGNSFFIDGHDYTGTLGPGPGTTVPGIATTGATNNIKSQLSNQQFDNVKGEGTDPSIKTVGSIDLEQIINDYKNSADIKFTSSTHYTGNLGNYDEGDFRVTHANGNLRISGGSQGAGLLLVDGNLEITGGWEFRGIVIVTGQVIFRGGGGGKRVVGTLLVGGDVMEGGHDEDLEVSGTVDILYSSTIQSEVSASVASFTMNGWQEL
jgi:hypothetical protein